MASNSITRNPSYLNRKLTIDRNVTSTDAGTYLGLDIDYDKTGASTSNNTLIGLRVNTANNTATDGTNTAYGISCTAAGGHADDAGTINLIGGFFRAVGTANGTSTATALKLNTYGLADTNFGLEINCVNGGNDLRISSSADDTDYCQIATIAAGATTISTVDTTVGATAHLTLDPDGDLIISGADTKIDATKKLYLDGGGDTYIHEASTDLAEIYVGGDKLMKFVEGGSAGNYISFENTAVGFTQGTPTYNATDTLIHFEKSCQKQFLTFGAGDIADLNLYFPLVSGNFILVIKQDGTGGRTVASDGWLAFASGGGAAAGSSIILWPGGTEPTLTTAGNAVDIISFYWDATNENAYGVISLDFK
jgi:hypothetical protein